HYYCALSMGSGISVF
nr:immunoglobulin light chain junction region [Macaca mulatta]MOY06529.1 immunoglobulin light chain junction region [Macaca mulatta]